MQPGCGILAHGSKLSMDRLLAGPVDVGTHAGDVFTQWLINAAEATPQQVETSSEEPTVECDAGKNPKVWELSPQTHIRSEAPWNGLSTLSM